MDFKEIKEQEKEQRRNIIIDAAEKLFFSRSYDDVSIEDIASEVGLSKTGFYRYFDSKESIFFAIILRGTKIVSKMLFEAMDQAPTGIDKVIAYRDVSDDYARQYPDYMKASNLIMSGRFNSASLMTNPDIQETIKLVTEMFMVYCRSIQAGIEDGTIRSEINPVELAVFLSIISDGITNLRPDLLMILTSKGISKELFSNSVKSLIRVMIANPDSIIQGEGNPHEQM